MSLLAEGMFRASAFHLQIYETEKQENPSFEKALPEKTSKNQEERLLVSQAPTARRKQPSKMIGVKGTQVDVICRLRW